MTSLSEHIEQRAVIVCSGAGGVGKTTTAAALSLAAARRGRRVLVLTIDPSRRLAETLGVARNAPEPLRVPETIAQRAGISPPGSLEAWMLDPKLVADQAVRRLVSNPADVQRLLSNPIYQQVTQMIAGMQEYTAMEALHGFLDSGRYDLVVLDTPPARNALTFLEAPSRLGRFLDNRLLQLFMPQEGGRLLGMTRRLIEKVLGAVFGEGPFRDLQVFFSAFGKIFGTLNGNAQAMRQRLQNADTTFLLITSPSREAIEDARFFRSKLAELELPFGGFILNRARPHALGRRLPDASLLPPRPTPHQRSALEKLAALAAREQIAAAKHSALLSDLASQAAPCGLALAIPEVPGGISGVDGLVSLAAQLIE